MYECLDPNNDLLLNYYESENKRKILYENLRKMALIFIDIIQFIFDCYVLLDDLKMINFNYIKY